ncbi:hypothetical protein FACS1894200_13290 [Spirochaetia bacterium]|nr:hypothetical protein FACS1894200_13290 [Spirochaetia bacterium]
MVLRKTNKKNRRSKINKKNLTDMLDLYSDYLLISTKSTTATGLSELFNGEISHDKVTRFLSNEEFDRKRLWLEVKKTVRKFENGAACLTIDDTIIEKAYMDENDIVCWHWDHSKGRAVKGINLISVFLEAQYGDEIIRIRQR